jgi:hypothetical protein
MPRRPGPSRTFSRLRSLICASTSPKQAPPEKSLNTSWLIGSLVFSSIGLGYFMYGKSQRSPAPLICGMALMIYPYFVSSIWLLMVIGAVLAAAPFFLARD